MVFERVWDSSCPHVWAQWEADGKTWIVQDLPPEDDEEAVGILVDALAADEPLCAHSGIVNEPESVMGICATWKEYLAKRTSLACYEVVNGKKKLVALNCCVVTCKGEEDHPEIRGKAWNNVYYVLDWMERQRDIFEYLGGDTCLSALGLVVKREYRGSKLGGRLLAAREPLARSLGVCGTATVFTGPASQKFAAKCGFDTLLESTWSDFADAGLDYPRDTSKVLKYMAKKYE